MADSQADVDAVLAEAEALAREAIVDPVAPPPTESPDVQVEGGGPSDTPQQQTSLARVAKIEMPVIVRLAERSMHLSDILGWSAGTIIEFEKACDAQLDLLVNNKCIGRGQAVKVGEKFGLRILAIGSLDDKIDALKGN
jgi:flagellar motor switch protein FliN/FliY